MRMGFRSTSDSLCLRYPTTQYVDRDQALARVTDYIRLGTSMSMYVVCGYVTIKQNAVDFSDAVFCGGGFFNYAVGGEGVPISAGGLNPLGTERQENTAYEIHAVFSNG